MFRGYEDEGGKVVMDKEYLDHAVFNSLAEAAVFYRRLSSNVMSFVPLWVKNHTIINYDSYFFEAIANSIISIKVILELGHVTDAKALIRNLFDQIIINLYFIGRLKKKSDDFNNMMTNDIGLNKKLDLEEWYDANVSNWLMDNKTKNLKKALRYDDMKKFLKQDLKLSGIIEYLDSDECKKLRDWLNDAVHLNYYNMVLLNDGSLCIDPKRKATLDEVKRAFDQITMFHIACVLCLKPVYMMSHDYIDYKDCGMEPPEGCEYDVSPFVQEYLEKTMYKTCPKWAEKLILTARPMRLRNLRS
jgi:hypothetical protein